MESKSRGVPLLAAWISPQGGGDRKFEKQSTLAGRPGLFASAAMIWVRKPVLG